MSIKKTADAREARYQMRHTPENFIKIFCNWPCRSFGPSVLDIRKPKGVLQNVSKKTP